MKAPHILVLTSVLCLSACSTSQYSSENSGSKSGLRSEEASSIRASAFSNHSVVVAGVSAFDKKACNLARAKYEKTKAADLIDEANSCVAAVKWTNVSDIGQELSHRDSRSPWGPYFLSLSAEASGQLERASWMAEMAARRSPELGLVYFQAGRVYWKRQDFKAATESFLKSIQFDPNLIDAHLLLGQVFYRDQDFGRAARHFQAVLRVRPKDPTALMGLAECHIQSADARSAIELLQKGSRIFASEPSFSLREAYVNEVLVNDTARAIEIYKSVAAGYQSGQYTRQLDFSLRQKILDLEVSVRGNRAVAGSETALGSTLGVAK